MLLFSFSKFYFVFCFFRFLFFRFFFYFVSNIIFIYVYNFADVTISLRLMFNFNWIADISLNNGEIQAIDVDEVDGPNGNSFSCTILSNILDHIFRYKKNQSNRWECIEIGKSHFDLWSKLYFEQCMANHLILNKR